MSIKIDIKLKLKYVVDISVTHYTHNCSTYIKVQANS